MLDWKDLKSPPHRLQMFLQHALYFGHRIRVAVDITVSGSDDHFAVGIGSVGAAIVDDAVGPPSLGPSA